MYFQSTAVRKLFPSLNRLHNGNPLIFLDGPAGTQVPQSVIDAVSGYYLKSNSNTHGAFITTNETDTIIEEMRAAMADLIGAEGPETISIGQNTTTMNFSLSRAMSRIFKPGDEVLITQLDHEANRGPWLTLREHGIIVKEVNLLPGGVLDYDDFAAKINHRTRLVCMGMSSNCIGTVNNVKLVRQLTYQYNAWLLLDAVHFAPHFFIDVQSVGCDFLLCSAYKFYGPHVGILYSKPGNLNMLPVDRLRTAEQRAPYCFETGTLNHAAIAGVTAAVDFIESLGNGNSRKEKIVDAYKKIGTHEFDLASKLYNGLKDIKGITIIGQDFSNNKRTPTVSFTLEGKMPLDVCNQLATNNICAWDGHFYAIHAMEVLGLLEKGGVTRLGISVYNTQEEVDATIKAIQAIAC